MKKPGGAAAVTALVVLLAGCSTPAPDVSPEPTATGASAATPPSALEALRTDYIAAGGQCSRIVPRQTAVADDAGDCEDGALLTTYSSAAQLQSAIDALQEMQVTNPSPHVVAVGGAWIVNGAAAETVAGAMGGRAVQIGTRAPTTGGIDLRTDAGLCAADAGMTNLELNDAIAVMLGYPGTRDARSYEQDYAIRDYKNGAFERACPARAS